MHKTYKSTYNPNTLHSRHVFGTRNILTFFLANKEDKCNSRLIFVPSVARYGTNVSRVGPGFVLNYFHPFKCGTPDSHKKSRDAVEGGKDPKFGNFRRLI